VEKVERQKIRKECLANVSLIPDPVAKTLTVIESDNDDSENDNPQRIPA